MYRIYIMLLMSNVLYPLMAGAEESQTFALVGNCFACHGAGGSSQGPAIPTIASMDKQTFIKAMQQFKQDERTATIMGRIAKGYSDDDFKVMAEFFSQQPFVRQVQKVDPEKVQLGKKLHDKYCEICHEQGGYKNTDGSAILAGQWMTYLQLSLEDLYSGKRKSDEKMKRRLDDMVKNEGRESLEYIIHYYASQNGQTQTDNNPAATNLPPQN